MSFVPVGSATIDGKFTTIRKYDNGFIVIEFDHDVRYSSQTFEELRELLDADRVEYTISQDDRDNAADQDAVDEA